MNKRGNAAISFILFLVFGIIVLFIFHPIISEYVSTLLAAGDNGLLETILLYCAIPVLWGAYIVWGFIIVLSAVRGSQEQ